MCVDEIKREVQEDPTKRVPRGVCRCDCALCDRGEHNLCPSRLCGLGYPEPSTPHQDP